MSKSQILTFCFVFRCYDFWGSVSLTVVVNQAKSQHYDDFYENFDGVYEHFDGLYELSDDNDDDDGVGYTGSSQKKTNNSNDGAGNG